ncbi:MAG TPA: hypothetical protein VKQ72_18360, partial [Aggregatilineales bacterium]|nr:hypothetical protein [Aggregatilineales bacterium]
MRGRFLTRTWQAALAAIAVALLVGGCTAAEEPVLPTARPSFTPSLQPSATATPVFNASPTATPVRVAIATTGPTPTFIIGDIPTPIWTPTATLVEYAPGSLEIQYFTTDSSSAKPNDKITLFWAVKGTEKATIYRLDASGKRGQVWNVGRSGTLDVQTRPQDGNIQQFLLTIGGGDNLVQQTLAISVGCTQVWFFDPQPDGCPGSDAVASTEVQQPFERGMMLWVQAQNRVFVLFNDGQQPAWATYPDEFKDGQP